MAGKPRPYSCIACNNGTIVKEWTPATTGVRRVRQCTTCAARFTTFQLAGGEEKHKVALKSPVTPRKLKKMRRDLVKELWWDLRNVGRVGDDTRAMARAIGETKAA